MINLKESKKTIKCHCGRKITYYEFNKHIYDKIYNQFIRHECVSEADGYIYIIKLKNIHNGEFYYYVGMSSATNRDSLKTLSKRLSKHITNGGDCALEYENKKLSYLIKNTYDDITSRYKVKEIIDIKTLSKYGRESKKVFTHRCRNEERKAFINLVREKDTMNILGGH